MTLKSEILQGLELARFVARRLHGNKLIGADELDSVESIADKLIPKVEAAYIIEPKKHNKPKRFEAEQFELPLPDKDDN